MINWNIVSFLSMRLINRGRVFHASKHIFSYRLWKNVWKCVSPSLQFHRIITRKSMHMNTFYPVLLLLLHSPTDHSPTGHSPTDHSPTDHSPTGNLPTDHLRGILKSVKTAVPVLLLTQEDLKSLTED